MGGGHHYVTALVNEGALSLGVLSPEEEGHGVGEGVADPQNLVGEGLPAQMGVGAGLSLLHRQDGVEEETPWRAHSVKSGRRGGVASQSWAYSRMMFWREGGSFVPWGTAKASPMACPFSW